MISFKKNIVLLILLLSIRTLAGGPDIKSIIAPTIKLGYSFGKDRGFIYGFELNSIYLSDNSAFYLGNSIGIDFMPRRTKVHVGMTIYYYGLAGLTIGPSVSFNNKNEHWFGYILRPFAGALIYPYMSYTKLSNGDKITEAGSLFMLPLMIITNRGFESLGL